MVSALMIRARRIKNKSTKLDELVSSYFGCQTAQTKADLEAIGKFEQTRIEELELSFRAEKCLRSAEIRTVGQLARRTEASMLKIPNFGNKSLREIREHLQERGLRFGMAAGTKAEEPLFPNL
jgi:DNA-directed RNA polymerase alpha subunit